MTAYYCTACGDHVRSVLPSIDPRYATGRCWTCDPDAKKPAPQRPLIADRDKANEIIRKRGEEKQRKLHELHNMDPMNRPKSCPDCRALARRNAGANA